MITIPTSELIGGLSDVLPHVTDPNGSLAGVALAWDGTALKFSVYDVLSGVTVHWVPGEGDESEVDDDEDPAVEDLAWGGDDDPWATFLGYAQVKEIVKVFRLPAKLWRVPVRVKCSPTGDRVTVERDDRRAKRPESRRPRFRFIAQTSADR